MCTHIQQYVKCYKKQCGLKIFGLCSRRLGNKNFEIISLILYLPIVDIVRHTVGGGVENWGKGMKREARCRAGVSGGGWSSPSSRIPTC